MYDDGGNRPQQARIEPVSEYNRQLVNITPQKAQMNENPVIQVPLPSGGHGPVSHATRELDDLMASLSDFKVSVCFLCHLCVTHDRFDRCSSTRSKRRPPPTKPTTWHWERFRCPTKDMRQF